MTNDSTPTFTDLNFYSHVFSYLSKKNQKKLLQNNLYAILTDDFDSLSRRVDKSLLQESCSVRNVIRSKKLADLLINEKGELQPEVIAEAASILKNHLYSLGPLRQVDSQRQKHLLKVLNLLLNDKTLVRLFNQIGRPHANKNAEILICQTLQLPLNTALEDVHAKKAVLAAWFCYLRQNVGSCFATAPAEIVQGELPIIFLQDLIDLLGTGRLKRTFQGVEYAVPMSPTWGNGDLKKPVIIEVADGIISPPIWLSQGLIEAFEITGFLPSSETLKNKIKQLQEWIINLFKQSPTNNVFLTTPQEIISAILQKLIGVNLQQLKNYNDRPQTTQIQNQLILTSAYPNQKKGAVFNLCERYYELLEMGKTAFKSLTDNPLLKAWEFTLASFSETKYDFSRWNLYSSLGLSSSEPNGIGQCIYLIIQNKLAFANKKTEELQSEYEVLYTQVKTLESRFRQASTEKEIEWLKLDYQSRANELHFIQELLEKSQAQGNSLVHLYENLYKQYTALFQDYFQEVYDADMQEVQTQPFDDSPAGFRLLYKHGRSHTSQWTLIKSPTEFIDSLSSFFIATEPHILHLYKNSEIERDVADVISSIILHIKTNEFLESAFKRMGKAHQSQSIQNPLKNLDKIEKKPWAYTSGGVMTTLVNIYFRNDEKPTVEEKWIESEMELLVFIADTLKKMPPTTLEDLSKKNRESLLMQSPTHAFLLKPFLNPFKEMWQNDFFTFTYIRDQFVLPSVNFINRLSFNSDTLHLFYQELALEIPLNIHLQLHDVLNRENVDISPLSLRSEISELLIKNRKLKRDQNFDQVLEKIDHLLYQNLPYCQLHELKGCLQQILQKLPNISSQVHQHFFHLLDTQMLSSHPTNVINAKQLQEICKALLCLSLNATSTTIDYPYLIRQVCGELGYSQPNPLIFADTNWVKDYFGFVVSPGTGQLELWRFDYTGSIGYPMPSWKQWLNGSNPESKWGIYSKPHEYGSNSLLITPYFSVNHMNKKV